LTDCEINFFTLNPATTGQVDVSAFSLKGRGKKAEKINKTTNVSK
jgi:hypothetical protein